MPDATNKESKEGHNDASQSGTQSLSQSSPPTLDQKPAETSSPAESPKVVTTPLRNQAPPLYAAPEPKQSDKQPSEHQETGMMGKLFCFATDLDSVPQEEVERRVEAAGGKIGPSVGQRTSYLVLGGNTADGRPAEESGKYQRFLQLREMGKATAEVLRGSRILKDVATKQGFFTCRGCQGCCQGFERCDCSKTLQLGGHFCSLPVDPANWQHCGHATPSQNGYVTGKMYVCVGRRRCNHHHDLGVLKTSM